MPMQAPFLNLFIRRLLVSGAGTAALVVGLAAGTAMAVPVPAGTISYDEASDGDLGGSTPTMLGVMGVGTNTVSGTANYIPPSTPAPLDFDRFRFFVPDDTQLVSVGLAFQVTSGSGPVDARGLVADPDGSNTLLGTSTVFLSISTSPADLTGFFPLPASAGEYLFEHTPASLGGANSTWSYTLSFVVEALDVPEPSTLALLAFGVAAAAGSRARRRSVIR